MTNLYIMSKLPDTDADGGGSYWKGPIQSNSNFQLRIAQTTPTSSDSRVMWMDSNDDVFWWDGAANVQMNQSGGGGGNSLDAAYEAGQTIDLDRGAMALTDATTGAVSSFTITQTGVKSGTLIDLSLDAAATGAAIAIDMNLALSAPGISLDNGGTARTGGDFVVTADSTGAHNVIEINDSGSGATVGFNYTGSSNGSPGGQAISLTFDNADGLDTEAILVTRGTGIRTAPVLDINDASTGSADIFDIDLTGVYTGDVFDFASSAAATGNVFFLNMDNAVAMTSIHLEGSGTRTQPFFELTSDATGSANYFDIAVSGTSSGDIFGITTSAAATGNAIFIDLDSAVAMTALHIEGSGTRTQPFVELISDCVGSVNMIQLTSSGTFTGDFIAIDMDAAVGANAISLDSGGGAKTAPMILSTMDGSFASGGGGTLMDINVTMTGAAASSLFDIDITGVFTGDIIDIEFGNASASTGSALKVTTGTNLAGNALEIVTAGARSAPVILITGAATDAGTDDHIIDINQTGIIDSNVLDITFDTNASTGNAIDLNMGSNVAGMAVSIGSAGTGVSGEGSCLDIAHTGDLGAGADVVRISSTGNISSTSNLLEIVQATGAGTAGANCLYINATGANVEAIRVDAGTVIFDETLTVTGASDFDTILFDDFTEVVTSTNGITAAESGSVFFLNAGTEFVSTLPAVAAGLHFTFIVTAAPSGASYTVVPASGTTIIGHGASSQDAGGSCDSANTTPVGTVTFVDGQAVVGDIAEFWCDGTNWFCQATMSDFAAITFS